MFFIAIGFVLIFRLQRYLFPRKYYELSRRVFGRGITLRMRIIRTILIFAYSILTLYVFKDDTLTVLTISLGSFLIVWPALLNPYQFDLNEMGGYGEYTIHINKKGKLFLYTSYSLFVLSSGVLAYLATRCGEIILRMTIDSFIEWRGSLIFSALLYIFFEGGSKRLEDLLDNTIRKQQHDTESYYE
ncbi:hypothetical protein [Exiguobacterium sp. s141]|uniref:hypothetical protein n=1 Tax=Exiguobacterium sp. s141 TaxID=2751240 RepID=UPI001BE56058|nr:hypothetical protein [Exiguobacterium sp. s141]